MTHRTLRALGLSVLIALLVPLSAPARGVPHGVTLRVDLGSTGGRGEREATQLRQSVSGCGGSRWVAAWAASPSDALNGQPTLASTTPATANLADQTIRQTAVLNASGDQVRIKLSNVLSSEPVFLGRVTVALAGNGGMLRGTATEVRFPNLTPTADGVVLPAGSASVSSPVALSVRAGVRLAVDMHVIAAAAPTGHNLGLETAWVSNPGFGDLTGRPDVNSFGTLTTVTTQRRILLSGVDVRASSYGGLVVAAGDSITDGDGAIPLIGQEQRWPDFLARKIRRGGSTTSVVNAGISANQVLADAGTAFWGGPSLLSRFAGDVLSNEGISSVVVLAGINDLGLSGAQPKDVIDGLRRLAQAAHKAGVRIAVGTLLPMGGAFYDSPEVQASRATVNTWIRHQRDFDRVVDFASVMRARDSSTRLRPAFDSGDHLHPSSKGYRAMARAALRANLPGLC